MNQELILSSLIGGVISGLVLSAFVIAYFTYERIRAKKAANQLLNNLKSLYVNNLSNSENNFKDVKFN